MKLKFYLLLVLALLLVACSSGSETTDSAETETDSADTTAAESSDSAESVAVSAPGELPIVEEPVTLRIMVEQRPGVEDYNTNAFTLWLEEETGIDLEFETVPQSDGQSKLNVTLASGDLPDVFLGMQFNDALLAQMGDEGLLLPLNDLIEEQSTELKRIIDEDRPHIRPLITSPDGNIYGMPDVNECFHCFNAQKMWVYQPWLDELGLELPETTAEFEEMLIAFKEQDPNGNGAADEVPFAGAVGGWNSSVEAQLLNAFVYYDLLSSTPRMINEDGTIVPAYTQEGYKEGLRYLNSLYEQGLIDSSSFTQDPDGLRQLANHSDQILGAFPSGGAGAVVEAVLAEDGGQLDNWVAMPALEGPDGFRTAAYAPWGFVSGRYVISADTEHPEVAFRLGDFLYTFDATIRNALGVQDENWSYAEEGVEAIGGGQALYQRAGVRSEGTQNNNWNQSGVLYRPSEFRLADSAEGNFTEVVLYEWTRDRYAPYSPDIEDLIPPLVFTADEAQELADIRLAVDTFVDEMQVQFITGGADIDADWDNYIETLDATGLPRMLEIYQAAFEQRMATN